MASKTVIGSDGREWQVRRSILWSQPATGEEGTFEHDVDGGGGAVILVLSSLVLFWAVLVAWGVVINIYVPWFYWLIALLIVGFFPVRWYLRRPWMLVATTDGTYEEGLPPEHWTGTVRGLGKSREETAVLVRQLRTRGTPTRTDTPLHPVN